MAPFTAVVLLSFVVAISAISDYASVKREAVSLTLSPNHESRLWSRDVGSEQECPESVKVNIKHNKRDVILDLQRNDDNQFAAPLLVNDGKRVRAVHVPASGCFYGDDHSDIVLRPHSDGMRVSGRYVTPDGVYGLETNNSLHHLAYQIATASAAQALLQDPVAKRDVEKRGADYYIEVMTVFSLDFWKLHLELVGGDDSDAEENIKYYCTQMMNEVDYIYRKSRSGVQVAIAACVISKTREASDCIDGNKMSWRNDATGRFGVRGMAALEDCGRYALDNLPDADHYMFMTIADMYGDGSFGLKGLAWINRTCTDLRFSIVQDHGIHFSGYVGAHEIGHNLGAQHDGKPHHANCDSKRQNTMASYIAPNNDKFRNAMTFSACSIDDFHRCLSDRECVRNVPDMHKYSKYDKPLISSAITLDRMCEETTGLVGSKYCGGSVGLEQVCYKMLCSEPRSGECGLETLAYQGTTCGNRKSCKDMACVDDGGAPEVKECQYGDSGLKQPRSGDSYEYPCEEIVAQQPGFCYNKVDRQKCCASCAKQFKNYPANCRYGNKEVNVNFCNIRTSGDCYWKSDRCCGSCKPHETGIEGCQFGDRDAQRCRSMRGGGLCYDEYERNQCCQTCNRYKKNDGECAYGDREERCQRIQKSDCYRKEKECCDTCARYKSSDPNCLYGNIFDANSCNRLEKADCYQRYYQKNCCGFCNSRRGPDSNCPFGDRDTRDCNDVTDEQCRKGSYKRKQCCESCKRVTD